jgi:hypothetical protein
MSLPLTEGEILAELELAKLELEEWKKRHDVDIVAMPGRVDVHKSGWAMPIQIIVISNKKAT